MQNLRDISCEIEFSHETISYRVNEKRYVSHKIHTTFRTSYKIFHDIYYMTIHISDACVLMTQLNSQFVNMPYFSELLLSGASVFRRLNPRESSERRMRS